LSELTRSAGFGQQGKFIFYIETWVFSFWDYM
jgi:hypothetical protein